MEDKSENPMFAVKTINGLTKVIVKNEILGCKKVNELRNSNSLLVKQAAVFSKRFPRIIDQAPAIL